MYIKIGDTRIRYSLEFYGKYSVIAGDSGTGKTTFFELVQDYNDNPRLVKCDSSLPVYAIDKRADESVLTKYTNSILVMDEDNRLLRLYNTASLLKESSNYYIIISRVNMNWLPLSIDNYYQFYLENGINYNKPIFPRYNKYLFLGIDQIVTEDKESGYDFFREHFENIECHSAHSKSEIVDYLENTRLGGKTLVVYDAAAFAFEAGRLHKYIENHDIDVLDWESFENYVLRFAPFNTVLTQRDCDFNYESLEQKSTEVLTEKIAYSKNFLPTCLHKIVDCSRCREVGSCKLKHSEFKTGLDIRGN